MKSGEIKLQQWIMDEALSLITHDPLLIRRPLLIIGSHHLASLNTAHASIC